MSWLGALAGAWLGAWIAASNPIPHWIPTPPARSAAALVPISATAVWGQTATASELELEARVTAATPQACASYDPAEVTVVAVEVSAVCISAEAAARATLPGLGLATSGGASAAATGAAMATGTTAAPSAKGEQT